MVVINLQYGEDFLMSGTTIQHTGDGYDAWLGYRRVAPGERYDQYAVYSRIAVAEKDEIIRTAVSELSQGIACMLGKHPEISESGEGVPCICSRLEYRQ
jgi:alpha-glucuronidase